jgi:acylphosphatase
MQSAPLRSWSTLLLGRRAAALASPAGPRRPAAIAAIAVMASSGGTLASADFEVTGRVQGVFFRACTKQKAEELGIVGQVRNTPDGAVAGTIQGPPDKLAAMKVSVEAIHPSPRTRCLRSDADARCESGWALGCGGARLGWAAHA